MLTSYDGKPVEGSLMGVHSYDGWNYETEFGNRLTSMWKLDETTGEELRYTFIYDANGRRIKKVTPSGGICRYYYNGDLLTQMTIGNSYSMFFTYDANGMPVSVTVDDTTYYYVTNPQGDVVGIVDKNGIAVAHYTYDAWGNVLRTHCYTYTYDRAMKTIAYTTDFTPNAIGFMNPLRYRGYIYDEYCTYTDEDNNGEYDTFGLYYLQSRFYNPEWGRFITADNPNYLGADGTLTSYNLFAYCSNNPVMGYDPSGHFDWTNFGRGAGWLSVGITAVCISVTILSCGAAAPAMTAVAILTLGAGGLTTINGAAEIGEAFTDYNFVRDTVFIGNQASYDFYANITATVAEIGSSVLGAYYASKGGNVCFVAGTLVQGADGAVPIESIEAGDLVWAWDEETGEVALKKVVQTFVNEATELVRVTVKGEEIVCTTEHPFYSPVKGWTAACKLRAGDILVTVNGEYVVVEKVQHEILEAPITVYNFEVEGFHTYYVSDTAVLVHNMCSDPSGSYEIFTSNKRVYVGKGTEARMHRSIRRLQRQGFDVVDAVREPAKDSATAFVNEYMKMAKYNFDFNGVLINKIMSPGFKLFSMWL